MNSPPKLPLITLLLSLLCATAFASRHPAFLAHRLSWIALGGMLFSSLFVEMPGLKRLLSRGWFGALFVGILGQFILPALLIGVPLVGYYLGMDFGGKPAFDHRGITVVISRQLQLFTVPFFLFCGTLGIALAFLKMALFRIAAKRPFGIGKMLFFSLTCVLATTSFFAGLVFDEHRAIASVTHLIQKHSRGR